MENNNLLWMEDGIIIKDKSEYRHAKEHIQKENLNRQLTYDSNTNIEKAMCQGADLYLSIDNLERIGKPVIKRSEMYFNCLLVIHGARQLATDTEYLIDITQERLEDIGIIFVDGYLRIQGDRVITDAKNISNLGVELSYEFEDLSCYFDEIYDYYGEVKLNKGDEQ